MFMIEIDLNSFDGKIYDFDLSLWGAIFKNFSYSLLKKLYLLSNFTNLSLNLI